MFFAKIPRHTRQNAITEGDLECILTHNCEGTEQLTHFFFFADASTDWITMKKQSSAESTIRTHQLDKVP